MQSKFVEVTPRSFNPMSVPGLSNEAREAVNAALKAMSTIEKTAAAAAMLGWPEQIVDAVRAQMQTITEMQIKTMDHMMDAWEEQLKSPNLMTASPSAMPSKLKCLPEFGSWPSAEAFQKAAINPLQFWMQFAEQWQNAGVECEVSERQLQGDSVEPRHQASDTRRSPQELDQVVRSETGDFLCIITLARAGLVGLNELALRLNSLKDHGLIGDWHTEGWHDPKTQLRAIVRFDTEADALSAAVAR